MARYHIGVIYERTGDLEAASREFHRSIDEGVGEASSLYHLAQIHTANGDEATAARFLERAREFGRGSRSEELR